MKKTCLPIVELTLMNAHKPFTKPAKVSYITVPLRYNTIVLYRTNRMHSSPSWSQRSFPLTLLYSVVSWFQKHTHNFIGFGTDESKLIEAIGATTPEDRFKIDIRFKDLFDKDLKDLMSSESSGDFGLALKMCAFGPVEAECYMIKQACKGVGSHKGVLYSILYVCY